MAGSKATPSAEVSLAEGVALKYANLLDFIYNRHVCQPSPLAFRPSMTPSHFLTCFHMLGHSMAELLTL